MSEPEKKVEEQETQGLSKAAKKRLRKKRQKEKLTEVAVQEVDYWDAPIEVDEDALDSNKKEFKKGTLKEYEFWKDQPVPQFCTQKLSNDFLCYLMIIS